jgi:hypothetical protein
MLTSIMTIVIVAFLCGLGLGFCWNTKGGKKMMGAEKELKSLRSALVAKQSEVDQAILMHDKSISVAYSVVLDYETIFYEMTRRNQAKRSAVILPFRRCLK